MSPKRILFLSNRGLLPIKDGHTRRSYNILKGLAEKNQVHFLSLFEAPEEVTPRNLKQLQELCCQVEFFPSPPKHLSAAMVARLVRSLFSIDPYTIWRHYSKPFLKRVDELILSGQFDLVHCDILPLCYTVRGRRDIFRSVTNHDVSYLKCLSMARGKGNILLQSFMYLEAWKLKRLERDILRDVDLTIVVSKRDKDVLEKLCPEGRFFVAENGVEIEKFAPSSEPREPGKIVWLGGFDHYPNREAVRFFLKKVFPLVKQEIENVSVDIVGGGVTDDLVKLTAGDSRVNFTGYVDDPLPYIHSASVFVAPIFSGGGTKLKILEAMAAGKAVVGTSVCFEGIDGTPGFHFLVADEAHSFAKLVVMVLTDESLRASLQINARTFVSEKYDFADICNKLNRKYNIISRGFIQ